MIVLLPLFLLIVRGILGICRIGSLLLACVLCVLNVCLVCSLRRIIIAGSGQGLPLARLFLQI